MSQRLLENDETLVLLPRNAEGNVLDPWRLSELMMDLGAMSVSVDDSSLGTDEEEPIMDDEARLNTVQRTFAR